MATLCPLCCSDQIRPYSNNEQVNYFSCTECDLVFMPKQFHLNVAEEKLRYDTHQNNPEDSRYRAFLSKVFNPVLKYISSNAIGLDFGSGPGPTLSVMFEEQNFKVDLFDKHYANNPQVFTNKYDFITTTEVAEHLDNPGFELSRLFLMLNADGVLAVMTQMLDQDINFDTWNYKNDPTHICFFSKKTMQYLANQWQAEVEFIGKDVVLFFKPSRLEQ